MGYHDNIFRCIPGESVFSFAVELIPDLDHVVSSARSQFFSGNAVGHVLKSNKNDFLNIYIYI